MTDREELLKQALAFEALTDAEDQRYYQIRSIKESLREAELQEVENEARVRAVQALGEFELTDRQASYYSGQKSLFINQVIGEWYVDQKKPLESRVAEQVEV